MSVVDRINMRYNNFVPGSSRLEDIGVIVHGLDATEDKVRPWAACPPTQSDCGFLSDRMSASIIWKVKGPATFGGGGGVILSPNATRVLCAYGGDGGTRGKTCTPPGLTDTCTPGCASSLYDTWCDGRSAQSAWCDGHPWAPSALGRFLELDGGSSIYNEAILDGFYWNKHLPHSIEALIGSPGDPQAVRLHERFLATYHLKKGDVPLLTFNKDDVDCPFHPFDAPIRNLDPNARLDYKVDGTWTAWSQGKEEEEEEATRPSCWFGPKAGAAPPPPEQPVVDWRTMNMPTLVLG